MDARILKIVDVDLQEQEEKVKTLLLKLKSYKIEGLKKEAQRIKETVASLDNITQESAFSNYPAFINSRYSKILFDKFNLNKKFQQKFKSCPPKLERTCT